MKIASEKIFQESENYLLLLFQVNLINFRVKYFILLLFLKLNAQNEENFDYKKRIVFWKIWISLSFRDFLKLH